MKKAEYIEKYGEEKYKRQLENGKKYRQKHKEKIAVYMKEYRENNKEKIAAQDREYKKTHKRDRTEYFKEYRRTHKDVIKAYVEKNKEYFKEYHKNYNNINKEKITEQGKEYRIRNKEKIAATKQKYRKTKMGRACELSKGYKRKDRESNFSDQYNISSKWIVENIFSGQKCTYCGDGDWKHLGCDRIDNNKPHTADNVVCSCFLCNAEKADRYSVEEFKQYRALHPRECDLPKKPSIELSENGALKKRPI